MIEDVAVLFVDPLGDYPRFFRHTWDEKRDARTYKGPFSVIAHPPCNRWINLGAMNYARYGGEHLRPGNDGGCFKSALAAVRKWGGVLEHPAYSKAWRAHGLVPPAKGGGWLRLAEREWTCYVEQHAYGHPARKATWLFYAGECPPPELRWQLVTTKHAALVSWCSNRLGSLIDRGRKRIAKRHALATPPEFRADLLKLARASQKKKKKI